ncbi:ABC-2 transporter permease [Murimonas intestini]|uniref:ABC-2 family transporter n=1 Tax=Murimonas intestini TaxID=1337051 RepID=A0AB73SXK1_9FIRM|nr:ABC-2 transporter permease [Murimonas intestini]MCR1843362.1 ABC-2 transporter permease [Murimonas intestini]MCR1868716.1 ABC-2 transporter permease [Murimonas intestini]MCR1886336.1 ABC-2 transporter permease [Murimonas intestini]
MTGLVRKDLLAYYRRSTVAPFIIEIVIGLGLVLFLKNIYSLVTVAVLSMPMNMSGSPTTLKEIEANSMGERYALTLPYSWKDFVKGRFLTAFADGLGSAATGLILILIHYLTVGTFSLPVYLQFWAGGFLLGCVYLSINTAASFFVGATVTAVIYIVTAVFTIAGFLAYILLDIKLDTLVTAEPVFLWMAGIITAAGISLLCVAVAFTAVKRSRRR